MKGKKASPNDPVKKKVLIILEEQVRLDADKWATKLNMSLSHIVNGLLKSWAESMNDQAVDEILQKTFGRRDPVQLKQQDKK